MPKNSIVLSLDNLPPSWDSPPPAGAERSEGPLACWRGRNGVLEVLAVLGDGGQPEKTEATGSKEELLNSVFVILRFLFFLEDSEIKTREICHICGASCL